MSASTAKVASLIARNLTFAQTYKSPGLLMEGMAKAKAAGKKATVIMTHALRLPVSWALNLVILKKAGLKTDFKDTESAIIRNAGGRTREALNSILALDAVGNLGTIIVIHHTDCGMSHTDDAGFRTKIEDKHPEIAKTQADHVYGAILNPEESVKEDVVFLKNFKSLNESMGIFGLVLDTHTGILKQVV